MLGYFSPTVRTFKASGTNNNGQEGISGHALSHAHNNSNKRSQVHPVHFFGTAPQSLPAQRKHLASFTVKSQGGGRITFYYKHASHLHLCEMSVKAVSHPGHGTVDLEVLS